MSDGDVGIDGPWFEATPAGAAPRDEAREAMAALLHERFCECGTKWSVVAERFPNEASDWYTHADAVLAAAPRADPDREALREIHAMADEFLHTEVNERLAAEANRATQFAWKVRAAARAPGREP